MPKVIYVLTNEAMPGLVKIGFTTDSVESCVASLSTTTGIQTCETLESNSFIRVTARPRPLMRTAGLCTTTAKDSDA